MQAGQDPGLQARKLGNMVMWRQLRRVTFFGEAIRPARIVDVDQVGSAGVELRHPD